MCKISVLKTNSFAIIYEILWNLIIFKCEKIFWRRFKDFILNSWCFLWSMWPYLTPELTKETVAPVGIISKHMRTWKRNQLRDIFMSLNLKLKSSDDNKSINKAFAQGMFMQCAEERINKCIFIKINGLSSVIKITRKYQFFRSGLFSSILTI